MVIFDIRLPRTVAALVVGAALGLAGAVMQGLLRNPLADPGVLGVSGGAGLGAALAISLGPRRDAGRHRGLRPWARRWSWVCYSPGWRPDSASPRP